MSNAITMCLPAKPPHDVTHDNNESPEIEEEEKDDQNDLGQNEEEDPYSIHPEDIYYTVDENSIYNPVIQNRPPAPIPRAECEPESEKPVTYISRGVVQSFFCLFVLFWGFFFCSL